MNKNKIIEEVTHYLEPITSNNNYELVDVEFVKEGPNYYLRIYIDKDNGVTIEDCVTTSRAIEAILDEKNVIDEPYILEVSSPGLDRVLKKDSEFEKFKGRLVDIKLYEAIEKKKNIQGILIAKEKDVLIIEDEKHEQMKLNMKNVAIVRLAVVL